MIPLVAIILGVAAGSAGVATRRWWVARRRPKPAKPSSTVAPEPAPPHDAHEPVGLGDVVVLDEGRGKELWLARRASLREGEGDPFLFLFDAEGPSAQRAIVAFDPSAPDLLDVVTACDLPECAVLSSPHARPPSTLDTTIDGAPERLQLDGRRVGIAELACAPEVDDETDGALPNDAVMIATYRGGHEGVALVMRDARGVRTFVGRRWLLSRVSVLRNRHA